MKVRKQSGAIATFDRDKLKRSLFKSGASNAVVEKLLQDIELKLYDGIPTRKIYSIAGNLLKKISAAHAARYNLRAAIQQLGPAGFFFEKFIARLFEHEGYQYRTNLILQGKCVSHEIDVLLQKDGTVSMVECKFHSRHETHSDVKIPMYILSRFNDLRANLHHVFTATDTVANCYIVTNNRFTSDAVAFATCSGLELLSWDYPQKNSLKTKVDNGMLYPITCLTTLSVLEKEKLLILDTILVKDLTGNTENLYKIGISAKRTANILAEATSLCNNF